MASFRLVAGIAAEGLSFATIVDVGANVGQFSAAALARWPRSVILAFEPLPEPAEHLRRSLARSETAEVHVIAVGDRDGVTTFHPHPYTLSSSILPVRPETRGRYRWAEEGQATEVPLCRLDTSLRGRHLERPVLLKLDVQGFELKALVGAIDLLQQVDAIVLEQSFERYYEDQPLFTETNHFLEQLGWYLARPLDWRRESGRVVEIDCLYRPGG
ncbi:MAG TPA: FkbM family methyltransferase [Acidimicrobiales bacterium]|nr:FkbM family methyltransferase [Acidimicrobiales bacterium]